MRNSTLSERYDDLVSLAYTGINESRPWQSFVNCLRETIHMYDASLIITAGQHYDKAILVTSDQSPHITQDYLARVLETDVMRELNDLPLPHATTFQEACRSIEWSESDLYRDFMKPHKIANGMLVDVWRDPLLSVRLSVDTESEKHRFGQSERLLLERLAKHLAKGISLQTEMRHKHASVQFYQSVMDKLNVGVLFINSEGRLVDANSTGSGLVSGRGGLCLKDGRLAIREGRNGQKFRTLLRGLLTNEDLTPQGMRLLDDYGEPMLEVVGRRLVRENVLDMNCASAVLMTVPCQQKIPESHTTLLRQLYGFTSSEAELAKLLTQGYSVQESSEVLGISINTAKSHLSRIFDKTGYNKQSQVIAFLTASPSRLM